MKIINGDILSIDYGIICHQVNCRGVMNSGLARGIRNTFNGVYDAYMEKYYQHRNNPEELLGQVQYVIPTNNRKVVIANIFGQLNYGRNGVYTDLNALEKAFKSIALMKHTRQIYLPYGIGCGLGGAKWEDVSKLIDTYLPEAIVIKLD